MNDDAWENLHAFELEQKHVGKLFTLSWTSGHTITGRLARLTFEQPTNRYVSGKTELGDRVCEVGIEIGSHKIDMEIPLNAEVSVRTG